MSTATKLDLLDVTKRMKEAMHLQTQAMEACYKAHEEKSPDKQAAAFADFDKAAKLWCQANADFNAYFTRFSLKLPS